MVEGGARIIASFFAERSATGKTVIDSLILTVAPIFVGVGGVGYGGGHNTSNFEHLRTDKVGNDAVIVMVTRNK